MFTDAEAGAQEFPDSGAVARRYNYFKPAKRKQTHYEDVTVEVQPDPRHYLTQGWIYGFADGSPRLPADWTKLKAWGVDEPEPERGPGSGGKPVAELAGPRLARVPRPQRGVGAHDLPVQRQRRPAGQPRTSRTPATRRRSTSGPRTGCSFVERNVGAWMHIEHILGLYVFAACNRSGPTNMHNTAMVVNSEHKIRFAQDLALYNLTLTEEIEGFDGAAHLEAWNTDPEWQGVRKVTEALTAVDDDWGESIFATNIVFEPLLGELFRSQPGACRRRAGNGDFVTPTVVGAGEYDYAQRDLRWTRGVLRPAHPGPRVRRPQQADSCRAGCRNWVPQCLEAARTDAAAVVAARRQAAALRGRLDAAKSRFAGILADLGLETPKELHQ